MKPKLLLILIIFSGCYNDGPDFPKGKVAGYKPIYGDSTEVYSVTQQNNRALSDPGKIYVYGNMLLINEKNEGIHVYNNINPEVPEKLYFLKIPGNIDMVVKNNILYADNYEDLVLIKLDINGIVETNRVDNALYTSNQNIPPEHGYFECVDPEKGTVIGWEHTTINSPECLY